AMMDRCKFHVVGKEDVKNEIRFFGKLEANNNKTAQVFSAVGGLVKTINVGLGDYVKQGQVLATIQSSEVATYEKERVDAVSHVTIADTALQVARDLYAANQNTEMEVKHGEEELEKDNATLSKINELYGIYNFKKGSTSPVTAPISGFVVVQKIN